MQGALLMEIMEALEAKALEIEVLNPTKCFHSNLIVKG